MFQTRTQFIFTSVIIRVLKHLSENILPLLKVPILLFHEYHLNETNRWVLKDYTILLVLLKRRQIHPLTSPQE